MRLRCIRQSLLGALIVACAFTHAVPAAEFAWPAAPYPYSVVDQDLKTVLLELGRNIGLRMKISEKVTGRVKGRIQHTTAKEFFMQICAGYGLEWHYDGFTMYVSSLEENQTKAIDAEGFRIGSFIGKLRSSAFYDPRFPLHVQRAGHNITLSGPPTYIALVDELAASLALSNTRTVLYRGENVSVVKFGGAKEEGGHN